MSSGRSRERTRLTGHAGEKPQRMTSRRRTSTSGQGNAREKIMKQPSRADIRLEPAVRRIHSCTHRHSSLAASHCKVVDPRVVSSVECQ